MPVRRVERLWGRLAELFVGGASLPAIGSRRRGKPDELVLAPRRLEPRRMLDAGAGALALELLDPDFVQAGPDHDSLASTPEQPAAVILNTPPTNVQITPVLAVDENGVASLSLTFDDPDAADAHQVEIKWGDGSLVEVLNLPTGTRSLTATHLYVDDKPSGTPSDVYAINVRVIDLAGASASASTNITVNNVPPTIFLAAPPPISESGVATLLVAFNDPGTADTHKVEINWGDGTPTQVLDVPAGLNFLTAIHQYLDDNPSGTPQDAYTITARVLDDDGGASAFAQTSVTVSNVAPSNVQLAPVAAINEGGEATLSLTFNDPGALDTHTVEIDWGDGSAIQTLAVPAGARAFSAKHVYLDDNPTGTSSDAYTIKVRVLDDDGGASAQATTTVTVNNVAPTAFVVPPPAINENGFVTLLVTFNDPGTLDTFQAEIDWGDGSAVQFITVPPGPSALTAFHQYLDDNPSGTSQDNYTIKVRVLDDDGGASAQQTVTATVRNVAPSNVQIAPLAAIDENGEATLAVTFDDPGSLDTHQVEVDWGDGSAVQVLSVAAGARTFTAKHQYLDDNPSGTPSDSYTITVRVLDDDGGVSAPATASVTVNNVPPSTPLLVPPPAILENGIATLLIVFDDPGTLDTHQVEIDWGDGSAVQLVNVPQGQRSTVALHQYLDDNPTGTPSDDYTIKVRVLDDDGGASAQATTKATVNNVAPTATVVPPPPIFEDGVATILIAFDDPGTLDTHKVEIDWGDGSAIEIIAVTPGARFLTAIHQYLDDNPTGTPQDNYTIKVRVLDDDGGASAEQQVTATVRNLAPSNLQITPPGTINENDLATLQLTFDDPGTQDTHQVEIDWGDGSGVEVLDVTPGARAFTAQHRYLDDNPTGTSQDNYTIKVRVLDDDGGATPLATTSVTVKNVTPTVFASVTPTILENGIATLVVAFDDPGTLDTHQVEIDWGDGSATQIVDVAPGQRSVVALHQYLDDNPTGTPQDVYTITVRVLDDDGGVSAAATPTVTVQNVAPFNVTATPRAASFAEGSIATVDFAFEDPGTQDTHTYVIDWGDGTATTAGVVAGRAFSASHTYADNGNYAVKVTVTDDDGGVGLGSGVVVVANVPPTLAATIDKTTIHEGQSVSIDAAFSDPGFDNPLNAGNAANGGEVDEKFTYTIDWGDSTATADGSLEGVNGSPGVPSTGAFNHTHTYADNGTYVVTVTVRDDDGGQAVKTFTVTVNNVDPTLRFLGPPLVTTEGTAIALEALVAVEDPGFSNPANQNHPTNGGQFQEIITAVSVDWGDGKPVEALEIAAQIPGSPGTPTTATFKHIAHTYADNGVYTVSVKIKDDDGAVVTRTFQITVTNVAPSLTASIDKTSINEGQSITIGATFTDPGFNNPDNTHDASNGGQTKESFRYTIDWGDGSAPTSLDVAPGAVDQGAPGKLTSGVFSATHQFKDNDLDNFYTITVTITDDDGGSTSHSFVIEVLNVPPTLSSISATDVNALGNTTLTLTFSDPGADRLDVYVDWGDGNLQKEKVYNGPIDGTFTIFHHYDTPPNPDNPADDIRIFVQVRDDDFGTGTRDDSPSATLQTTITNPGTGNQFFRIDTTPKVPMLTFPVRPVSAVFVANVQTPPESDDAEDEGGAAGESKVSGERELEIELLNADGVPVNKFKLSADALNDLPRLFRRLPDGHYKIWLVQPETQNRRPVMEVFVRDGKLIDPNDDSEGARDRPPMDETPAATDGAAAARSAIDSRADATPSAAPLHVATPADAQGAGGDVESAAEAPIWRHGPLPSARPSATALRHGATLASVALALSAAGRSWRDQVDQSLAKAKSEQRKQLKTVGHWRGTKKPR
jgi:PKD repeat protein